MTMRAIAALSLGFIAFLLLVTGTNEPATVADVAIVGLMVVIAQFDLKGWKDK